MANRPNVNLTRFVEIIKAATAVTNFMTATLRLVGAAVSLAVLIAPFVMYLA